jgi:hypothetical protein
LFAISNPEEYFEQAQLDWWNSINDSILFNGKKQFYKSLTNMFGKILMPSGKQALIIGLKDTTSINEILPFMTDSIITNGIRRIKKGKFDFSSSTFSGLLENELKYIKVINDYLVLSENENDVSIFNNAFMNNSSILNNERFKVFAKKNFDTDFHYLKYCLVSTSSINNLPFSENIGEMDIQHLKNIGHFSFLQQSPAPCGW